MSEPATDRILAAASRYVARPYGHPASRVDTSCIDCSTLTAHVLDDVFGLSMAAWLDVVVADAARPWSPIERAFVDGWGEAAPDGPVWSGWHLIQAWRDIPTSGHAMLGHLDADGVRLSVLEATSRGPRPGYGVRWRGVPMRAPLPLSLGDAVTTTALDLEADYPGGVRWARLVGV